MNAFANECSRTLTTAQEARLVLETGALPIELLPYGLRPSRGGVHNPGPRAFKQGDSSFRVLHQAYDVHDLGCQAHIPSARSVDPRGDRRSSRYGGTRRRSGVVTLSDRKGADSVSAFLDRDNRATFQSVGAVGRVADRRWMTCAVRML